MQISLTKGKHPLGFQSFSCTCCFLKNHHLKIVLLASNRLLSMWRASSNASHCELRGHVAQCLICVRKCAFYKCLLWRPLPLKCMISSHIVVEWASIYKEEIFFNVPMFLLYLLGLRSRCNCPGLPDTWSMLFYTFSKNSQRNQSSPSRLFMADGAFTVLCS